MARQKRNRWEAHGFVIRARGDKFQCDFGRVRGRRERKRAATLEAARELCAQRRAELTSHGLTALALTPSQRADAVDAIKILADVGVTLRAAARFYHDHHRPADQTVTVAAAVPLYLDALKNKGKRPDYIAGVKVRTKQLADDMGSCSMASVTRDDVEGWLDAHKPTLANRLAHIRVLSPFWRWAIKKGFATTNPWREQDPIKLDGRIPVVATPAEARALMQKTATDHPDAVVPWALLLFAGLRPTELLRLTWADIDEAARIIRVGGAISKTRAARLAPITDNLACWLAGRRPADGGPIVTSRATWIRRRRKTLADAKVAMGADVPRHSFVSYRLADTGDEARTALEAGHSVKVLHEHYKSLVPQSAAKDYFAIVPPPAEGNIIPMGASASA